MEPNENDVKSTEDSSASKDVNREDSSPSFAETMQEVIDKALPEGETDGDGGDEDQDEGEQDSASKETEVEAKDEKSEAEAPETKEDDSKVEDKDKQVPFAEHPRWKEVLSERDTARDELVKSKPLVEQANTLNKFCEDNRIGEDQLVEALQLLALLNSDPAKALEKLQNTVDGLSQGLGRTLPADLKKEVDDGLITEARAKEIAQLRAKATGAEKAGRQSQMTAEQAAQQSCMAAVNQWDTAQRAKDPDFKPKVNGSPDGKWELTDMFAKRIIQSEGLPRDPQQAVKLYERAYAEASRTIGAWKPRPSRTAPVLSSRQSSGKAKSSFQPKNLKELVRGVAAGETYGAEDND